MSKLPQLNVDPLISNDVGAFSPSRTRDDDEDETSFQGFSAVDGDQGERSLLLNGTRPRRKPFYRARPMWLVPFAFTAALVRGMTLAPRVEVFTQLSCNSIQHRIYNNSAPSGSNLSHLQSLSRRNVPLEIYPPSASSYAAVYLNVVNPDEPPNDGDQDDTDDPREIPSPHCLSDPDVQAAAARLQTIMVITMGALSAMTTGWWGHFAERHGRTKVLAASTLGAFLTDLAFILASTPNSPFAGHGHKLLYAAPVLEGLLGGWSTLQSATSAYISDCTSPGSRAQIFSRFTGVFYLGLSAGPAIGGWLIRNSASIHLFDFLGAPPSGRNAGRQTVTAVFWTSVFCSLVNFVLLLVVFPESLSTEKMAAARFEHNGKGKGKARASAVYDQTSQGASDLAHEDREAGNAPSKGFLQRLLSPLAVFYPVYVFDQYKMRKRKDWSLSLLAVGLFCYMLSTGIYQIKYLYATHIYGWSAEQLSYYISFLGGFRATFLLFILPFMIATFKPQPGAKKTKPAPQSSVGHMTGNNIKYVKPSPPTPPPSKTKPKLTKAHLGREIQFDLQVTRMSLLVDILSNAFITFAPAPSNKVLTMTSPSTQTPSQRHSQALFVLASSMSSFSSGVLPAVQSLALCLLQARDLAEPQVGGGSSSSVAAGKLFGALATLQAVGQMIIGPLLFGIVYTDTVATFPKAVFATSAAILAVSLAFFLFVRSPVVSKGRRRTIWVDDLEVERGRSRVSKDLRPEPPAMGGYASYGAVGSGSGSSAGRSSWAS
ncbi:hypothetical protein HGRIS_003425 [Hohenbuehelia grisea]|uniref:MFS general substrate transporter n=1 Tax=Hohenbuehelia grisea TaxID=104357 RepID=A0ABR3JFF3_9AGAR